MNILESVNAGKLPDFDFDDDRTTPELLFIETKWACLIPFEKTANLLKDLLPVSETLNGTTIQNNLYDLVMTQEKEIGGNSLCLIVGASTKEGHYPNQKGQW